MKRSLWVLLLSSLSSSGRCWRRRNDRRDHEWPSRRRRPRRHETLDAHRHQPGQRSASAGRVAMEALGDAPQGVRHRAGPVRGHSPHDRWHRVRDDAVQQHAALDAEHRQGTLAVRRRRVRARQVLSGSGGSCAAPRYGAMAGDFDSSSTAVIVSLPSMRKPVGRWRRLGTAAMSLTDGCHASRTSDTPRKARLPLCTAISSSSAARSPTCAAARSNGLRAGVQRAHGQARVDVLGDSNVGEGPWR